MDVDSNMLTSEESDHDSNTSNGPTTEQLSGDTDQEGESQSSQQHQLPAQQPQQSQPQSPQPQQQQQQGGTNTSSVVGPRCAPTYTAVNAIIEKKEDGPGPRCGHTLTAVPAVGEEGSPGYIGPRLILFGGATALEGNSAASGTPSSAGSAGISMYFFLHF